MSRDVHQIVSNYAITNRSGPIGPGSDEYAISHQWTTGVASTRGRSDLIHSNGIYPTPYGAWEISIVPKEHNYFQERLLWGWVRRDGKWYREQYLRTDEIFGKRGISLWALNALGIHGNLPYEYRPIFDQYLYDQAHQKAILKLIDSEVNLGVTIGEARESAGLLADALMRLLNFINLLRKKRYGELREQFGLRYGSIPDSFSSFSENFLAYQLGWRPLINDLFNLQQGILDALNIPDFIRVEARVEKKVDPVLIPAIKDYKIESGVVKSCRVGMTWNVQSKTLNALNRLGLVNPAAIAWELSPLSFVADYIVGIGNFLTALGAPLGLSYSHGYYTFAVEGKADVTDYSTHDYYLGQGYTGSPGGWKVHIKHSSRRSLLTEPHTARVLLGSGLTNPTKVAILAALKQLGR